jgi:alkaline phosphatase
VTGDHETGGMAVGHATTGYSAYYEKLVPQTVSFTEFGLTDLAAHKAAYTDGYDWTDPENLAGNVDMLDLLWQDFGLDYFALNAYQQEKLEDAYDRTMSGENDNSADENKLLYGNYDSLTVTATHILNEIASIGWTSYSHTGVPVPLFAQGIGAEAFSGFYDNTDIAKKVARAMGVRAPLPVAE